MRVALLGYGKMGKMIERIALQRGHEVLCRVTKPEDFKYLEDMAVDVAIDFSVPDAAVGNIKRCVDIGLPVVVGTTGWYSEVNDVRDYCVAKSGAVMYGANFSVGVNMFFVLNKKLAMMMNRYESYKCRVAEQHHTEKKDAPSGTAIKIAEQIIENNAAYSDWSDGPDTEERNLPILSKRVADMAGTHEVIWANDIDTLTITHVAHNREGFAAGAVDAAEWLQGRKGFYAVQDMFTEMDKR